jgi:hypothetical protein
VWLASLTISLILTIEFNEVTFILLMIQRIPITERVCVYENVCIIQFLIYLKCQSTTKRILWTFKTEINKVPFVYCNTQLTAGNAHIQNKTFQFHTCGNNRSWINLTKNQNPSVAGNINHFCYLATLGLVTSFNIPTDSYTYFSQNLKMVLSHNKIFQM